MHLLVNDYYEFLLKPVSQILFYIKIVYMKNSIHLSELRSSGLLHSV